MANQSSFIVLSSQDILENDSIELDEMFKFSLLYDLVKVRLKFPWISSMQYLPALSWDCIWNAAAQLAGSLELWPLYFGHIVEVSL